MKILIIPFLLIAFSVSLSQETIDISVKGISDGVKHSRQRDREEAIMDAQRQACEKAGLKIESKTTVENFQTTFDFIESQAKAILLPGFQIIDIGYVQDGTYQVVLSGKVKPLGEEPISTKEMRYAKSLKDRGKSAYEVLNKYIDGENEEIAEEALFLFIKWGYSREFDEDIEKYNAYYPDGRFLNSLRKLQSFRRSSIITFNKKSNRSYDKDDWEGQKFGPNVSEETKRVFRNIRTYQIIFIDETSKFKEYNGKEHELRVRLDMIVQGTPSGWSQILTLSLFVDGYSHFTTNGGRITRTYPFTKSGPFNELEYVLNPGEKFIFKDVNVVMDKESGYGRVDGWSIKFKLYQNDDF